MDDNKVLTLASNERIALTKEMRLLFEVGHLQSATPATVSRGNRQIDTKFQFNSSNFFFFFSNFCDTLDCAAGILYVNDTVLGWYPYV